jgi:hypothetical protein
MISLTQTCQGSRRGQGLAASCGRREAALRGFAVDVPSGAAPDPLQRQGRSRAWRSNHASKAVRTRASDVAAEADPSAREG